jgi:hypothetical protein
MSKAAELAALIGSQTALSPSRNFIINGGMRICQRPGTSTASITGSGVFVVDRWKLDEGADSTLTMSQETLTSGAAFDAGLNHSLKVLVTTADTSIGSSQSVQLTQPVEAQNLQTLKFGSSGARNLTLSFYYKSNVTGVHTVCIDKIDSTRATCPLEFTVSSANTWERYVLKAVANSAVQGSSGAIANDNGTGFRVMWGLAYGSDYLSGTSGTWEQNGTASFSTSNQQNIVGAADNYVELTGVQLEIGDVATPFEHEDVNTTLKKCQRYYHDGFGAGDSTNYAEKGPVTTQVWWRLFHGTMRVEPTATVFAGSNQTDSGKALPAGGTAEAMTSVTHGHTNYTHLLRTASVSAQNYSIKSAQLDAEL